MKKIITTTLLLVSLAVASQAQDRKFWVSGSLGFSSAEADASTKMNTLSIQPKFGYFFSDRWGVGISLGLSRGEFEIGNTFADFQEFSVAPFARYIFLRWKALTLFVDGGIDFSDFTGDTDFEDDVVEDARLSSFGFFVKPGFSVRLTDRFSLVGNTNFFSADHAWNDQTASWSAGLNSPFNLDNFTLGFSFKF